MSENTFLVEIGTEELPPKALRSLAESFAANVTAGLDNAGLVHGKVEWFAAPRRLVLKVTNLATAQVNHEAKRRGSAITQAFDAEDKPNKATKDWTRGYGIAVDQARRLTTNKGEWLLYYAHVEGESTEALLPNMITSSLAKLPIPKLMRWGTSDAHFVHPVHTATLPLGDKVIPATILGILSDRVIREYRFMDEPEFTIDHVDQYPQILPERGKIIVDYEQRRTEIGADAEETARKTGGQADLSESLLEEVASLVEQSVVLTAKFEEKFLAVPSKTLVHAIKGNQGYFPVYDNAGKLLPNLIFVANIEPKDPQQIISGNEKVVRPHLVDAKFFFNADRKERSEDSLPRLETMLFRQQLRILRDKTDRIQAPAGQIVRQVNADVSHATRVGLPSECDLMTNTVFEFTDTQGVMGTHYARHDGEAKDVTVALNEQYQPRFVGDALPSNPVARTVAITDKVDTLAGIFSTGQHPKDDEDPSALRRAALDVLHIIVEKNLPLDLMTLTVEAIRLYGNKLTSPNTLDDVETLVLNRFRAWYQGMEFSIDAILSVLELRPTMPVGFDARVKAIIHFWSQPDAASLAATNKRVSNILSKRIDVLNDSVHPALLTGHAEQKLTFKLAVVRDRIRPLCRNLQCQDALIELAAPREPVDEFFESVIVNAEDKDVHINRLTLLSKLHELFLQVANIPLLQ